MDENDVRHYKMMFYTTGAAIMFLLWAGFEEAGLSAASGYALTFTALWIIAMALHTPPGYRVGRKKIDAFMGWGADADAN